ncbi:MAG TPA: helix-turn-helix domain-containing protein [Pseudonocardia sp.]|jgi:AcrR family transcriptional regulator
MVDKTRPLRADAARNRARVLEVAYETFAAEGLAVPIDEIARRAGVGAGTVYRHFPTKEALFEAIASNRIQHLVDSAARFAEAADPGTAFLDYLDMLIEEGRNDQGLMEALAGIGYDVTAAIPDAEKRFMSTLEGMLVRAQECGAVRPDIEVRDVKALMVGCQAMLRYTPDPGTGRRTLAVMRAGLLAR